MIKGIIFDFNGTIVWDVKYQEKAWKTYFKSVTGKDISNKELEEKFYGVPMRISLKEHLFPDANLAELDEHIEEKEEMYRQLILDDKGGFSLAPGLEQLFDELKEQDFPMTIATASVRSNVDFFIEQLNLEKWFDTDKIIYDNGNYPDKRGMFIDGARNIGVRMEDLLIFEDSTAGIKDAAEVGCRNLVAVNLGKSLTKYENVECLQLIEDYDEFDREIIK